MDPNASTKAKVFLSLTLLFHVMATTTTACNTCNNSSPTPSPSLGSSATPSPSSSDGSPQGQQLLTCPKDAIKLGVCVQLLAGLVVVEVGSPLTAHCCALLAGMVELEVAACICTAVRANILGINLKVPITLSPVLSACGIKQSKVLVCTPA